MQESKDRRARKEQQIIDARKAKHELFTPQLNEKSKKMRAGVDLLEDAARRRDTKKQLADMLASKAMDKASAQISSKSDKVMYDRFDADFVAACQDLDLIQDDASDLNTNDMDIKISCAQMSQLFLNMGFVRSDGREAE